MISKNLGGDYTVKGIAQSVFEESFRQDITEKAKKIEDVNHIKIRGVLLSQIKTTDKRLFSPDGLIKDGDFLLGASYLI
jgi:hypothetical protein